MTKNDKNVIFLKILIFSEVTFSRFLHLVPADLCTLLAPLKPPPKGGCKLFFVDHSGHPLLGLLVVSSSSRDSSQQLLLS
jgi:hypothetical protein